MAPLRLSGGAAYADIHTAPFHPGIHNLGNTGVRGAIHAAIARPVTDLIDQLAYGGYRLRPRLAAMICGDVGRGGTVMDVGCGVGTLTEELARAGLRPTGVDASPQMVAAARRRRAGRDIPYTVSNGVEALRGPDGSATDAVVICMVMHELPPPAQQVLLETALEASETVWVADISTDYVPSRTMLSGEPYLLSYLSDFDAVAYRAAACRASLEYAHVARGRVKLWRFTSEWRRRPGRGREASPAFRCLPRPVGTASAGLILDHNSTRGPLSQKRAVN